MTLAASSGTLSLNISQMINSEGGGGASSAAAAAINLSAAGSASSPLSTGGVADVSPSVGSSASEMMRCVTYTG